MKKILSMMLASILLVGMLGGCSKEKPKIEDYQMNEADLKEYTKIADIAAKARRLGVSATDKQYVNGKSTEKAYNEFLKYCVSDLNIDGDGFISVESYIDTVIAVKNDEYLAGASGDAPQAIIVPDDEIIPKQTAAPKVTPEEEVDEEVDETTEETDSSITNDDTSSDAKINNGEDEAKGTQPSDTDEEDNNGDGPKGLDEDTAGSGGAPIGMRWVEPTGDMGVSKTVFTGNTPKITLLTANITSSPEPTETEENTSDFELLTRDNIELDERIIKKNGVRGIYRTDLRFIDGVALVKIGPEYVRLYAVDYRETKEEMKNNPSYILELSSYKYYDNGLIIFEYVTSVKDENTGTKVEQADGHSVIVPNDNETNTITLTIYMYVNKGRVLSYEQNIK